MYECYNVMIDLSFDAISRFYISICMSFKMVHTHTHARTHCDGPADV